MKNRRTNSIQKNIGNPILKPAINHSYSKAKRAGASSNNRGSINQTPDPPHGYALAPPHCYAFSTPQDSSPTPPPKIN